MWVHQGVPEPSHGSPHVPATRAEPRRCVIARTVECRPVVGGMVAGQHAGDPPAGALGKTVPLHLRRFCSLLNPLSLGVSCDLAQRRPDQASVRRVRRKRSWRRRPGGIPDVVAQPALRPAESCGLQRATRHRRRSFDPIGACRATAQAASGGPSRGSRAEPVNATGAATSTSSSTRSDGSARG